MAYPVRPDSYSEINIFYTSTIYNKGAEVIRMMHTLLGADNFRKGMDLYFTRHDGQAVTCHDFACAMTDAFGIDLSRFKLWCSQSWTPRLQVSEHWNESSKEYELAISQSCLPTPGQEKKENFHIPVAFCLLDGERRELALDSNMLQLLEEKESFSFSGLAVRPVLSLLRGFSAPVVVEAW